MSYQVLARKWRPKNFNELMGQEHVVTVLVNALQQQRLHHAYLFTGTRGVGKTTIARIFAKSLNCETGITSTPCGKCDVCLDIDDGRFVDLLEIDAASRTKVDDTREILDNVQYAPTRGRYKVYLIDEVHMLSRSSFNALLKTLEEPPEHVKFILATTDPQKLPVTVLSRCLQFHLKALTAKQIETKLIEILAAENVEHDAGTLALLAKAARGSMRDSLSLTDQAIAQGQGHIELTNVQSMLGSVDQHWPFKILIALVKNEPAQLMALSQEIASYAPSYSRLFAEIIQLLHQIAMNQVVHTHFDLSPEHNILMDKFCKAMSPEDVQLYYQIMLNGRKDLPYAGDEQAAFDMALLRLLAFKPVINSHDLPEKTEVQSTPLTTFDDELSLDTKLPVREMDVEPVVNNEITASDNTQTAQQQNTPDSQFESRPATDEVSEQILNEELLTIENAAENIFSESPLPQPVNENVVQEEAKGTDVTLPADEMVDSLLSNEMNTAVVNTQSVEVASTIEKQGNIQSEAEQNKLKHDEDLLPQENVHSDTNEVVSEVISTAENENIESAVEDANTPIEVSKFDSGSIAESPVAAVLATRNMLRSRKKKLEKTEKKSSDASERQNSEKVSASKVNANVVNVPDVDSLPDKPFSPEIIDPSVVRKANQVDKWANMVDAMALNGRLRQLAINATIDELSTDENLILCLNQSTKHLKSEAAHQQLEEFVSGYFARPMTVEIQVVEQTIADPYQIQTHINDKRYDYAKELLLEDETVKQLQEHFQATLNEDTVKAL